VPAELSCRFCATELRHSFADLGSSPLANAFLRLEDLGRPERFYPLHAYVCTECFLVQLAEFEPPEEIFSDYVYFSSVSDSWVEHARRYAEHAVERFRLGPSSSVIEIASNDGYLLQFFKARGIPVLGVEPAANVAAAAQERGIPTVVKFFGRLTADELLRERRPPNLVVANNVLAHVPGLNDFVAGVAALLAAGGVATLEFPHLLRLIEGGEFDTIYHEHFSYFSLHSAERVFSAHGLELFDVEELPTHGGSLRIYARIAGSGDGAGPRFVELREVEREAGISELETYCRFEERVRAIKRDLLEFLITAKRDGRSVVAYGAAAKGNTLLNYCGIRSDFVDYVVDRSPHKQGRFLPGTRLPVHEPERVAETRPDYLLILPWNLKDEIIEQMAHVREFGCRFVTPIPTVQVHD
jgi:C-methyltransferase C-terminal domain/Putative zinc binding domain/Methyltransferase domain